MATKNLDWKTYESITKYIYETLGKKSGVKIEGYGSNCKATGKSGVIHQIDVLTTHSDGIHNYQTAIECKYWKEKVNKDIVMKLSEVIEDTGINKGIIVSKNGFTQDGIAYAKFKNIGLVTLREWSENDQDAASKEVELGILKVNLNITITRPELLQIDLGNNRFLDIQDEFDLFNYYIVLKDGKRIPFYSYVSDFRLNIAEQNKMEIEIVKLYKMPESCIYRREIDEGIEIDEVIITGKLIKNHKSKNLEFRLLDKIWLIMKSIFDERTFSFSENGVIKENIS